MLTALIAATAILRPSGLSPAAQRVIDIVDTRIATTADEWFKLGMWNDATQLLRIRAIQYPSDYEAVTDYGFLLESMEADADALKVYRQYVTDAPADPSNRLPEAAYWYKKRQYIYVIRLIANQLPRKPDHTAYMMLAFSYEKLGDFAKAIAAMEQLQIDYPSDSVAADALKRMRKRLEAAK